LDDADALAENLPNNGRSFCDCARQQLAVTNYMTVYCMNMKKAVDDDVVSSTSDNGIF
jgi:hypothetical protein